MKKGLYISPKKVAGTMIAIVVVLVALSIAGQYFRESFGDSEIAQKVISKFNLDEERNNIPTWYQSSTLLLSSVILLVIGFTKRALEDKDAKYWWLLSAIFLFLSIDEAVSIHEQLTMPLRTAFDLQGILFLSWVIPAAIIVLLLAGVFARFLFRLPARTRYLIMAAGCIFVSGAIGLEMAGANYMFLMNDPADIGNDFRYALITSAEEFLEMSGIVLFIYSLLSYVFEPLSEETKAMSRVETQKRETPVWSIS